MKLHKLSLGIAAAALLVATAYAKQQKMPLPQRLMAAKTVYIDNRSGHSNVGDKCFDELSKWGRFQIVDSPEKADIVLLLSAEQYISGYSSDSYHNTTGDVDRSGNISAQTYGNSSSDAVMSGITHITVLDPKDGTSLWADSRVWGKCAFGVCKSATRGLVKELRERVDQQEGRK
jgi:hypothetical protein